MNVKALNRVMYDRAEFFDSYEYEECLRCLDEDEAIADAIDAIELADGESLRDRLLKEQITIYGFCRKTIPPIVLDGEVTQFIQGLNEYFDEQYGEPDGDGLIFDTRHAEAVLTALQSINPNIWACESCGYRILEGTELVDWVKKNRPDWV